MTEEMIACPKCKGCGEIKKPRSIARRVRSFDPTKKWCPACKSFFNLDCFYKGTGYCKPCQKIRSKARFKESPISNKKFEITCMICHQIVKTFSSKQITCSRKCHMERLNSRKQPREKDLLPSYLIEELTGKRQT